MLYKLKYTCYHLESLQIEKHVLEIFIWRKKVSMYICEFFFFLQFEMPLRHDFIEMQQTVQFIQSWRSSGSDFNQEEIR